MKRVKFKGVPVEIIVLNRHFRSPDEEVFEETMLCFNSIYSIKQVDENGIDAERLDINIPIAGNYLPPVTWEKLQDKHNVFTLRRRDIIVLCGRQWVIDSVEDRSMQMFGKHFRVRCFEGISIV